jgi:hypothetical protein
MTAPVYMVWDGDNFTPIQQHRKLADKNFVVGEMYPMIVHEDRSQASHRQYFAALHDAWLNLPEAISQEFLNEEQLRKHALIATGYCDKTTFPCASAAEAQRLCSYLQPIDAYAIVHVSGNVLTRYTAHSQSQRAMGKKTFQKSKDDVLNYVAAMVGVKPADLQENARKVA